MISIIIRNKNEANFIGYAIQSCIDQFSDPEIIIVDDDSIDDSYKVVSLFDRVDINFLKLDKRYSPGYSINYGVANAKFENILLLSAHCQILQINNFKDNVLKNLDQYCAVFGKQIPIYRGKKITQRYIWSHFKNEIEENMFSKIEGRNFLHNAFSFYRRDFLLEFPFDESLSGKEDRYWAIDRVKEGKKYLYNPNLICNHFYTKNGATWKGIG